MSDNIDDIPSHTHVIFGDHSHSISNSDDFFIPVSKNTKSPTSIKLSDLKKLRADTFDRWAWDTGTDEDKELFEKLDKLIETIYDPKDAGFVMVVDNDDET